MSDWLTVLPLTPDEDTLARTLWGEARGCGLLGMYHVANVIVNRVKHPGWWGNSISTVCLARMQFSCWNLNDPNLAKMKAVDRRDTQFIGAGVIAREVTLGKLVDQTGGADSYYAIGSAVPSWAAGKRPTFSDGFHTFYIVR